MGVARLGAAAETGQQLGTGGMQIAIAGELQRVHDRQRGVGRARLGDGHRAVERHDR